MSSCSNEFIERVEVKIGSLANMAAQENLLAYLDRLTNEATVNRLSVPAYRCKPTEIALS